MMWKALASLAACRSNGLASWSRGRVNLFFTRMASINFTTEAGSSFPLALITFGVCILMRISTRIPHAYPCVRIPVCNCMRILLVSCDYMLTFGVCILMRISARIPHAYLRVRIPVCNCMRISQQGPSTTQIQHKLHSISLPLLQAT